MKKSDNNKKEEKKLKNPSEFLSGLKEAVDNGDRLKGSDVIKQINEIAKKSQNVDLESAQKRVDKMKDDVKPISEEERKNIEAYYNDYISKINKEDTMLAQVAIIKNIQSDIINVEKDYKKILENLEKNHLNIMENLVTELENKQSGFRKIYGDEEYKKYFK